MPWVLHRVALNELVVVVHLDLIKGVKSFVIALVVTTANQVQLLGVRVLHALEIMRKTTVVVWLHLDGLDRLVPDVELVNVLRIFLEEVHHLNCWPRVPIPTQIEDGPLLNHGLPHGRSTATVLNFT